jgi:hypothetical protein
METAVDSSEREKAKAELVTKGKAVYNTVYG